jgi:putative aldouronate transport system substrate-binding protein
LILIALLVAVPLAGCGRSTPEPTAETGATDLTPPPAVEKPAELIWIMGNPGQVPPEQAMVEEKLNEISVAALNAKVTTLYYDNERTMLALSAGDEWDMAFTCEWFNNFATQARAGYYADLTDLLPTVAPDLYATMPEIVWEGAKVDGKIYAIPVKKDYAAELFWVIDKELFEDTLGMTIPEKMSFFDIRSIWRRRRRPMMTASPARKRPSIRCISAAAAWAD